jgi:hypothetical protein
MKKKKRPLKISKRKTPEERLKELEPEAHFTLIYMATRVLNRAQEAVLLMIETDWKRFASKDGLDISKLVREAVDSSLDSVQKEVFKNVTELKKAKTHEKEK